MGLRDRLGNRNKPKMESGDNWTVLKGRQARQHAQTAKLCKQPGCNNTPGGHSFKFVGSKEYCKDHARTVSTERGVQVAKRVAKKPRSEALDAFNKEHKKKK